MHERVFDTPLASAIRISSEDHYGMACLNSTSCLPSHVYFPLAKCKGKLWRARCWSFCVEQFKMPSSLTTV